jgi:hypothetical protein
MIEVNRFILYISKVKLRLKIHFKIARSQTCGVLNKTLTIFGIDTKSILFTNHSLLPSKFKMYRYSCTSYSTDSKSILLLIMFNTLERNHEHVQF